MGLVRPIPTLGGVVRDARGAGRALRVSWHAEDDLVVLSLWDGPRCTGTFRLAATDVPALIEALQLGLPLAAPEPSLVTAPPAYGPPQAAAIPAPSTEPAAPSSAPPPSSSAPAPGPASVAPSPGPTAIAPEPDVPEAPAAG